MPTQTIKQRKHYLVLHQNCIELVCRRLMHEHDGYIHFLHISMDKNTRDPKCSGRLQITHTIL